MANLLTADVIGALYDGTAHNANNDQIENSFADLGPSLLSGLAVSAGAGLAVSVALGVASIGGRVTVAAPFSIAGLAPSTTNHLYLLQNGTGTANTTGTQPALSAKLGTCVTGVATVTSVSQTRSSGCQQQVRTETLVPGGPGGGNPASINLAGWAAAAADGVTVYGTLPGGALGALTLTGDLTLSAHNLITDTTTGSQIATGVTQKLGFFGAAPVAQIAGTTDVLAGMVTLGFRAASANPPLNLGTGHVTAGQVNINPTASTIALPITGASGQTGQLLYIQNNLGTTFFIVDAVGQLFLGDGSNLALGTTTGTKIGTTTSQKLGFFGTAAVAQQANASQATITSVTDANAKAALQSIYNALKTLGLCAATA